MLLVLRLVCSPVKSGGSALENEARVEDSTTESFKFSHLSS